MTTRLLNRRAGPLQSLMLLMHLLTWRLRAVQGLEPQGQRGRLVLGRHPPLSPRFKACPRGEVHQQQGPGQ